MRRLTLLLAGAMLLASTHAASAASTDLRLSILPEPGPVTPNPPSGGGGGGGFGGLSTPIPAVTFTVHAAPLAPLRVFDALGAVRFDGETDEAGNVVLTAQVASPRTLWRFWSTDDVGDEVLTLQPPYDASRGPHAGSVHLPPTHRIEAEADAWIVSGRAAPRVAVAFLPHGAAPSSSRVTSIVADDGSWSLRVKPSSEPEPPVLELWSSGRLVASRTATKPGERAARGSDPEPVPSAPSVPTDPSRPSSAAPSSPSAPDVSGPAPSMRPPLPIVVLSDNPEARPRSGAGVSGLESPPSRAEGRDAALRIPVAAAAFALVALAWLARLALRRRHRHR